RRRALAGSSRHRARPRRRAAHKVCAGRYGMTDQLPVHVIDEVIGRALAEDLGVAGDVTTSATIPAAVLGSADLVARRDGVVAGLPVAARVFETVGQGRVRVEYGTADGARVGAGEVLATVRGPVRDILTAERTALNLLGHLSGIATLTRAWVDAV